MNKNAKYDTDYVTLGDLKNYMSADGEGTDNIIRIIPKSYAAPPPPPYYVGSILYYEHSVYRCKTERKLGNFNWDDWSIVATDNDVLLTWINDTYVVDKAALQAQIDQKAETYYQATDPATWTTDLEKSKHVGDFWYNTTNNTQWRYSQFATNPITYGWRQVSVPDAVFDLIDTKKSIYVSKPTSYNANDLWIIEDTLPDADLPVGTASNPIVQGDWVFATQDSTTYNKAHWVKLDEDVSMSYLEDNYYTSDDVDDIADTKVDTTNYTRQAIIQKINDNTSQVLISADNVNLSGYVTMTNLSTSGQTTINGANITTGTISADRVNLSNYLTVGTASSTYETIADASSTYETKSNASSTYETKSNASSTYETKSNASSTYASKSSLSAGTTTINGGCITTGTIKSTNYVANTSGTKIDLSNGVIDSKNFKIASNGEATFKGAITGGSITAQAGFSEQDPYMNVIDSNSTDNKPIETRIWGNGIAVWDYSDDASAMIRTEVDGNYAELLNGDLNLTGDIYKFGVPYMEWDSNAYGTWIKFANGMMVCFYDSGSTEVTVNGNAVTTYNYTFPAEFSSPPLVLTQMNSNSTSAEVGYISHSAINISETDFDFRWFNKSSQRSPRWGYIAIGMWT